MDHSQSKKITRRQFIKGTAVAAALPLLSNKLPFYGSLAHAAEESDLVIAKTGSASQLLQAAMAPLGGMGRFVKKGQRVVIKANIAWEPSNANVFVTKPGAFTDLAVAAIREVTGRAPELSTSGGTSDARFISNYCPVIEFGLVGQTMHQIDERTPVADLEKLTRIYRGILDRYFG